MLEHRSGTKYEDMYWIDLNTEQIVASELESQTEEGILYSSKTKEIISNFTNNYTIGIVICHDGSIYLYSAEEEISQEYYALKIAKHLDLGYSEKDAQIMVLNDLKSKFNITFKEVFADEHGK